MRNRKKFASAAMVLCGLLWCPVGTVYGAASVTARPDALATDDPRSMIIYQIITDRFVNADTTNDDPPQSKGLFDPTRKNWQAYWGGDLAGVESKIDYLRQLGVNAIWISPVADNVNVSMAADKVAAPYHAYCARDMKRLEEHFGDANNSLTAFDSLAAKLHQNKMQLVVDFVPNHSNPIHSGEFGMLLDDGRPFANPKDQPALFHPDQKITDWNDPDQLQHRTIFDLADLDQAQPSVDGYLKESARVLQDHGADVFRIDSMKHINWDWLPSFVQALQQRKPTFVFGEWFQGSADDATYKYSYATANESKMSELDYPLAIAARRVFGKENASMSLLRSTIERETKDFARPDLLVTFIDNHDMPRFASIQPDEDRLHIALAFLLTARGIPCIYYGTEQNLHCDIDGGNDPYDRPMMQNFGTDNATFRLIQRLAELRKKHPALVLGDMKWISCDDDKCVFEREYCADRVRVSLDKKTNSFSFVVLN